MEEEIYSSVGFQRWGFELRSLAGEVGAHQLGCKGQPGQRLEQGLHPRIMHRRNWVWSLRSQHDVSAPTNYKDPTLAPGNSA